MPKAKKQPPRQKPIPVTSRERDVLEDYKQQFENHTGDTGDWGEFLSAIALLGLAAAGIYALAKNSQRVNSTVNTQCSLCAQDFLVALPPGVSPVVHVLCPNCQTNLVIYTADGQSGR